MNSLHPDYQLQLSQQKMEKDRAFIIKEKMFKTDLDIGAMLNRLGTWMVAKGERLRRQYANTRQNTALTFMQDQTSVFKA